MVPLEYIQFLNFKATKLKDAMKVDQEGKAVRWNQIVSVRLSKDDPDNLWYKYNFDDLYRPIRLTPRVLRGRAQPKHFDLPDIKDMDLYHAQLPISLTKKKIW